MSKVYYAKVRKEDIAYLRFIFEGYGEIGNVRTLDSVRGYVEFIITEDLEEDFHIVIKNLREEITLELIDRPEGYESLIDFVNFPNQTCPE